MSNKAIYETKISDKRWIAYDIPGNIGWILYVVITIIVLIKKPVSVFGIVSAFPALLMLVGVIELIRERIVKIDRVLPSLALALGFGDLTLGGLIGFLCGIYGMIAHFSLISLLSAIGGLLCFVFAGLLLAGYKKRNDITAENITDKK